MPSANTVAQKPAGNFSPLSSLGQDGVLVPLPELDWLRAGAIGSIRHNTATQHSRVLFTWSRRIEPSGDRLRKNANDFITFLHAPTLAPPRKGAGSSRCRAFPRLPQSPRCACAGGRSHAVCSNRNRSVE